MLLKYSFEINPIYDRSFTKTAFGIVAKSFCLSVMSDKWDETGSSDVLPVHWNSQVIQTIS